VPQVEAALSAECCRVRSDGVAPPAAGSMRCTAPQGGTCRIGELSECRGQPKQSWDRWRVSSGCGAGTVRSKSGDVGWAARQRRYRRLATVRRTRSWRTRARLGVRTRAIYLRSEMGSLARAFLTVPAGRWHDCDDYSRNTTLPHRVASAMAACTERTLMSRFRRITDGIQRPSRSQLRRGGSGLRRRHHAVGPEAS